MRRLKKEGHEVKEESRTPEVFGRRILFRRLVVHFAAPNPVCALQSGNTAFRANRPIAELDVRRNSLDGFLDVLPAGASINENSVAGGASQQLIDGHIQSLALDVPDRCVNRGNRTHGDRATAPVGTLVKVLPDVLDPPCIAPDQEWNDMVGEIAGNCEFAAV